MSSSYRFPADFAWGVATSAYQIEGGAAEGGRSPSSWDRVVSRTGDTGIIANDHYHRFAADIDLMADLGIKHYRLSISWPRIIPTGRGAVNEAGIDFYKRILDRLELRGITPHVTLYHWDHPQILEDLYGGFQSRDMASDLATYAGEVVRRLGDRVTNWFTLNEVPCFTQLSYTVGPTTVDTHAPRKSLGSQKAINQTTFHALLAHGMAVQAIRAATPRPCRVAFVDNAGTPVPLTETEADIAAARKAFPGMWHNGQVICPVLTGRWGSAWEAAAARAGELPDIRTGDMAIIHQPLDALGINVYSGQNVRAAANADGFELIPHARGYPRMDIPWLQVVPEAIYWSQRHMREVLGFQGDLYITENGCAADDVLTPQGEILDNDRIHYLRQYLRQLHRGIDEGLPTKGYFLWSFMDNYEWSWGNSKRFGIVWNSFETQQRIPKASAHWYREVIRQNRVV